MRCSFGSLMVSGTMRRRQTVGTTSSSSILSCQDQLTVRLTLGLRRAIGRNSDADRLHRQEWTRMRGDYNEILVPIVPLAAAGARSNGRAARANETGACRRVCRRLGE